MATKKTPPPARKRTIYSTDNAKVVLTCADLDAVSRAVKSARNKQAKAGARAVVARLDTHATGDPYDRAHATMKMGMLVPLEETVEGFRTGKARRYHRDQMTIDVRGRRVSWDSAYDAWATAKRPMERAGITLSPSVTLAAMVRGAMAMTPANYRRVRNLIEQPTRQSRMTEREKDLQRQASAWIRDHQEKQG